jgi:hypothetical protein
MHAMTCQIYGILVDTRWTKLTNALLPRQMVLVLRTSTADGLAVALKRKETGQLVTPGLNMI